jgi:hypothetical protein
VANVRGTLAVSKSVHRFNIERFNFKELNEVGGKEQ